MRADIEKLKQQVRKADEWETAGSTVHLAGSDSFGYTDRINSKNGIFSVDSFLPIADYQFKDLLMNCMFASAQNNRTFRFSIVKVNLGF